MKSQFYHLQLLLKRLSIALLLFVLCRVGFYLFNLHYFSDYSFFEVLPAFFYGLRFDLSALLYLNLLFIFFHILPHPWQERKEFQYFLKGLFYLGNTAGLLLNFADFEYFPYTLRRTTSAVFGMQGEILHILPQLLLDYWYLLALLAGFLVLTEYLYRKTEGPHPPANRKYSIQALNFIVIGAITVIGGRGGLQYKPISPMTASQYTETRLLPLVTNTPFVFLYSLQHQGIDKKRYFSRQKAKRLYPVNHQTNPTQPFRPKNVMIIVLESFSQEYVGALNGPLPSYTPFLDSLCHHSLVFPNSYANGTQSMEAIPAICASIPALMDDPFITSLYQHNKINGIGDLLKEKGYHTSFYYGAQKGSMGFDGFAAAAGFDHYYAMEDYPKEGDYDGHWGIYDEPYFQYVARQLEKQPKPFCSLTFSITSHTPLSLPKKYQDKLPEGKLPIHKTIRYTDLALQRFFRMARTMDYYDSTLFIITGDHIAHSPRSKRYQSSLGRFSVPLLLYAPGDSLTGTIHKVVQQTDILPTVLDYLHYKGSFIAFGQSMLDTTQTGQAFQAVNNVYQYITDSFVLHHNGQKPLRLYRHRDPPRLQTNILEQNSQTSRQMEQTLKAILQNYHTRMRQNQLTTRVP